MVEADEYASRAFAADSLRISPFWNCNREKKGKEGKEGKTFGKNIRKIMEKSEEESYEQEMKGRKVINSENQQLQRLSLSIRHMRDGHIVYTRSSSIRKNRRN